MDESAITVRREDVAKPELAALRAADPVALADALRTLLPDIRLWLRRMLGARADLDDATQDALLALSQALPSFEGRSSMRTFAQRITVRVGYRYFSSRPRSETLALVPPHLDTLDPESRAMDREALRRLYVCLGDLQPRRRMAFVLCCIEGLPPREAAEIEGCSPNAMRTLLSHARADIAERLKDDPYMQTLSQRRTS